MLPDQRQFRLEFYNSLSRFNKLTIPKEVTPAAMIAPDTSSGFYRIRKLSMAYKVDWETLTVDECLVRQEPS